MTDDQSEDQIAPGALERSGALFKRGFEISDSLSPGTYLATQFKTRRCRGCHRTFKVATTRGGQVICPECHGEQQA